MNSFETFIDSIHLYWQYPVITEKTFYQQNKHHNNFIGIPWATILDKVKLKTKILSLIKSLCKDNIEYFTCCQHIHFRKLIPFFKMIHIKTLYTPHKVIGEDNIDGIQIIACPLYAVNIEDPTRNMQFKNVDFLQSSRTYLYSFMGGYNPSCYLSNIRKRLFDIPAKNDCIIKNSGMWHFEKSVYSNLQNYKQDTDNSNIHKTNTTLYNTLLLDSRYSLCPSGSGPNSIRLWESLACGSIPIILADTLELPSHELWDKAIIRIKEKDVDTLDNIIRSISYEKEVEMRKCCLQLYKYFKNNYRNEKRIM